MRQDEILHCRWHWFEKESGNYVIAIISRSSRTDAAKVAWEPKSRDRYVPVSRELVEQGLSWWWRDRGEEREVIFAKKI